MNSRSMYLIGMLALLFLANLAMLMGMTNWPARTHEGFATAVLKGKVGGKVWGKASVGTEEHYMDYLSNGFGTAPIGSYDGVNLAMGLPAAAQGFRAKSPNVPLDGPEVVIGPDNLFLFKNNHAGPECCDSTLSCSGGCVCTTPAQRDLINTRGGNRSRAGGDF